MEETTLKIAIAAFMHDIGKFTGSKELEISLEDINDYDLQLYLPSYKNRYSHYHAVYTSEFINKFKDFLPYQLSSSKWGEGDIFVNLAAKHHDPETPMQWVITTADRVASGWDRDTYKTISKQYNTPRDYKKTRLIPIFEQINIEHKSSKQNTDDYTFRYPLEPLTPKTIFPKDIKEAVPETLEQASDNYKNLYNGFIKGLKNLSHIESDIELWFENFESLIMVFCSHIPAARVGNVIPDVSLYDHSKITAALATSIYLYHAQNNTLTIKDIKSDDDYKFLLINGDFKGIQNYIFTSFSESEKFRSKILRGRSLAVSLFSELSANIICQNIGLPSASIALNAAGKFTIIAPNTSYTKSALKAAQKIINNWLVKISFGETIINISTIEACCKDFTTNEFSKCWDKLCSEMEEQKALGLDMEQYSGCVDGYLDTFINDPEKPSVCPFCGKRPVSKRYSHFLKDEYACAACRDHIFLGTNIVKKNFLVVKSINEKVEEKENNLFEPFFGKYQISFFDKPINQLSLKEKIVKYWNVSTNTSDLLNSPCAIKFINGYIPKYTEQDKFDDKIRSSAKSEKKQLEAIDQIVPDDPKSFNYIACMSKNGTLENYKGISALGILKADVDNLGLILACGVRESRFTISRLSTMSRQMNYFFSVYLPYLFKNNNDFINTYTVFAGGDDLFLIGPWNSIIKLAEKINKKFYDYVCHNPDIHLSAGITIHKSNTPINVMAESAESFLDMSKDEEKNKGKNRVTLYGETVLWPELEQLNKIETKLQKWLDNKWISHVMFYKINHFINMIEQEKRIINNNEIHMKDMECTKWRSLLTYMCERNIARNVKAEERKQIVEKVTTQLIEWLNIYGSNFRIPIWKIFYNQRQER